jgi:hypothetical protein
MDSRKSIKFRDAVNSIDVIWYVDKRRWQWLGHVLCMKADRNPRRALDLLDTNRPSLLDCLPIDLRKNIRVAAELASDTEAWNTTFEEGRFVSVRI